MNLSEYVRILGRGPGRSRSLTQDESFGAMMQMLQDDAPPEAVGAILMLLRMKGETAPEIAGFAGAAQSALGDLPPADLDWPSYAAGRTRGAPWFLKSAKHVAGAGHRVMLHGWNGAAPNVRQGLADLGIGIAKSADEAATLLDRDNIAYLPLETLHPALFRLLRLRDTLGLRSCINTVCRMLNPTAAPAGVQGVFHPSYRVLQSDAAALMGWKNLTVIKGGGGEFECNPSKDLTAMGLRDGQPWQGRFAASVAGPRALSRSTGTGLGGNWSAQTPDVFEAAIIDATAAAVLRTFDHGQRHSRSAA